MSEWISVKERLPEHGEVVLVCDNREATPYIGLWTLEPNIGGGDCWNDEAGWWRPFAEVTHWMPLPEPPNCGTDMRGEKNEGVH